MRLFFTINHFNDTEVVRIVVDFNYRYYPCYNKRCWGGWILIILLLLLLIVVVIIIILVMSDGLIKNYVKFECF